MTRSMKKTRSEGEEMERLVRDCYRSGGYVFAAKAEEIAKKYGFSRIARLASNENPNPPPQEAVRRGCRAMAEANRYPDQTMASLVAALSQFHGNFPFVTGVGMDGVIETLIRALVDPGDTVAISTPTFSFYGLAARAQSARVVDVPRREDFTVDPDDLVRKAKGAKISFLCSPNNPTGTVIPKEDVARILAEIHGVLFLDCAYVEFSGLDYRPLLREFENLVIGRTMSKAFGLAGARVGYALVPDWLAPVYRKASTPFTLNVVSAEAAIGALSDGQYLEETISFVREWRDRFTGEIPFPVFPSGANFVMVDVAPWTGDRMMQLLAEKGVLVRSCASFPGLADHYIRVSIGKEWENERFLDAVEDIRRSP